MKNKKARKYRKIFIPLIKKNRNIHKLALKIFFIPDDIKERRLHNKTDYYLISFPKCGRTWLRLIIGRYMQEYFNLNAVSNEEVMELTPLSNHNPNIPFIRITHDDNPQLKYPNEIQDDKKRYKNKKVIFLVRDPKDVVVSLYFQFLKREKRIDEISLSDFLRYEKGSLKSIIKFYNVWNKEKKVPKKFLLIKYENLHSDIYDNGTYNEVKKVLNFLGLDIDNKLLNKVVADTYFDKMRDMEKKGKYDSKEIRLSPTDPEDNESFKTRKGKVGGYKDYCGVDDIRYLKDMIKKHLNDVYGY